LTLRKANTCALYSDEDKDHVARNSNLQQVADYIKTWSTGNAVIVMGDTNTRYTRTADTALRTALRSQSGLNDPWVQLQRNGVNPTAGADALLCDNPALNNNCEIVDKIFYRGSRILTLAASSFKYDGNNFLNTNADHKGAILSDHNPILTSFSWSVSPTFRQSSFWGGPHGTWFSSLPTLPASPVASTITFSGAERLDSVGIKLASGTTFSYGGTGGTPVSLTLASGENWVKTELCSAQLNSRTRIFYIQATTSTGRTLKAGTRTTSCVTYTADAGFAVVGFMGQGGDEIDQLALVYAPIR
jgi:hypothetical protein